MIKITPQMIVKQLPLDADARDEILQMYETGNELEKSQLLRLFWKAHRIMYNFLLEKNLQLARMEVGIDKNKFDQEFYKRVVEKTNAEIEQSMTEKADATDLDAARKAMELIVREIRASKKKVKN